MSNNKNYSHTKRQTLSSKNRKPSPNLPTPIKPFLHLQPSSLPHNATHISPNVASNPSSLKHFPKILCNINVSYSYSPVVYKTQVSSSIIDSSHISLNDILQELDTQINLEHFQISYQDMEHDNSYIYCGTFPLTTQVPFPCDTTSYSAVEVNIKLRQIFNRDNLLRMEFIEEDNENGDEPVPQREEEGNGANKNKRAKERKIGYIIKTVYMWRKMYCGFIDDKGKHVKLNLEEAADKIGISKKSLDDYLIQLRMGKMLGFNFNEHKNDKVGVLRTYIKKNKSALKKIKEVGEVVE